jgi:hypothetical protein
MLMLLAIDYRLLLIDVSSPELRKHTYLRVLENPVVITLPL